MHIRLLKDADFAMLVETRYDLTSTLLSFSIISGHENSELRITLLCVQFTQEFGAFHACAMLQYFGLLIGNGVAYFPVPCACYN